MAITMCNKRSLSTTCHSAGDVPHTRRRHRHRHASNEEIFAWDSLLLVHCAMCVSMVHRVPSFLPWHTDCLEFNISAVSACTHNDSNAWMNEKISFKWERAQEKKKEKRLMQQLSPLKCDIIHLKGFSILICSVCLFLILFILSSLIQAELQEKKVAWHERIILQLFVLFVLVETEQTMNTLDRGNWIVITYYECAGVLIIFFLFGVGVWANYIRGRAKHDNNNHSSQLYARLGRR